MKFEAKYTLSDYYKALLLNAGYSKLRWIIPLVGLLFLLYDFYLIYTSWMISLDDMFIIVMGILFLFYRQTLLRIGALIRFRRMANLRKTYTVTISDKEIKTDAEGESSKIAWANFSKILYNDEMILLYRAPGAFHILSKQNFNSENDWKKLVDLVKNKASAKFISQRSFSNWLPYIFFLGCLLLFPLVILNKSNQIAKTKNTGPFVIEEGNNTYTLHEPGTQVEQVKMAFEGPFKKDTNVNWKTTTLDFNTTKKLEIPLPADWTVQKIDNLQSFKSNDEKCKLFSSNAYVIKSTDNFVDLTYNPTCNKAPDDVIMHPEDTLVTITFEDSYADGKNAQASRFFDSRHGIYRYGPSSGGGNPKGMAVSLFFASKDGTGDIFISMKYTGPENKKQDYLRIVDWIDAHPDIN